MGIRESLNQNPKVVTGVTIAVIVLALAWIFWPSGAGEGGAGGAAGKAFFSIDDGKSFFVDEIRKVPPFPKDGKDAYRAYVYKCRDGKRFVSHLERYTPDAKKKLETILADTKQFQDPTMLETIQTTGVEVKAPGQGNWVRQGDPKASAIMTPKCTGGGDPEPVLPD